MDIGLVQSMIQKITNKISAKFKNRREIAILNMTQELVTAATSPSSVGDKINDGIVEFIHQVQLDPNTKNWKDVF